MTSGDGDPSYLCVGGAGAGGGAGVRAKQGGSIRQHHRIGALALGILIGPFYSLVGTVHGCNSLRSPKLLNCDIVNSRASASISACAGACSPLITSSDALTKMTSNSFQYVFQNQPFKLEIENLPELPDDS